MGCIIGSAVAPIAMGIMSQRANKWGCIAGAWIGLACGLIAWLVTAATLNGGSLTIETTGQDYPMLAGNLAALGVGTIISVTATLIWPENYDFDNSKFGINGYNAGYTSNAEKEDLPSSPSKEMSGDGYETGKEKDVSFVNARQVGGVDKDGVTADEKNVEPEKEDPVALQRQFRFSVWFSIILALILLILVSRLLLACRPQVCESS
jgi:hypothetical protein